MTISTQEPPDGFGFPISTIPPLPDGVVDVLGVIFFAAFISVFYRSMTSKPADGWHEYRPPPWKKIAFLDGTSERGPLPVFRRRAPDGLWEYRRYEDRELRQWNKDEAV
jgi:hypothetical protein